MLKVKCVKADKHPNADKLSVYKFTPIDPHLDFLDVPGFEIDEFGNWQVQIVANETNIYQVNDLVDIVIVGEEFEDVKISSRKMRGVMSYGMALGHSI